MKERFQQENLYGSGYVAVFVQVTRRNVVARGSRHQMGACSRVTPAQFRFSQHLANYTTS
jgi:hypothetical protein